MTICTNVLRSPKNVECPPGVNFTPNQTVRDESKQCYLTSSGELIFVRTPVWRSSVSEPLITVKLSLYKIRLDLRPGAVGSGLSCQKIFVCKWLITIDGNIINRSDLWSMGCLLGVIIYWVLSVMSRLTGHRHYSMMNDVKCWHLTRLFT